MIHNKPSDELKWLLFALHDSFCTTRFHFFSFSFVSFWTRKFYLCLTLCKMGTSAQCATPQYCRCDEIKGKYKRKIQRRNWKENMKRIKRNQSVLPLDRGTLLHDCIFWKSEVLVGANMFGELKFWILDWLSLNNYCLLQLFIF